MVLYVVIEFTFDREGVVGVNIFPWENFSISFRGCIYGMGRRFTKKIAVLAMRIAHKATENLLRLKELEYNGFLNQTLVYSNHARAF